MVKTLTIRRPDDFHLHVRDGVLLRGVLPATVRYFGRAIIMPNLAPPVVTSGDAEGYRGRIMSAVPDGFDFTPLMTAYLTQATDADDIERGFGSGILSGVKLYPAGATTNSALGVVDMGAVAGVLERMAEIGMPLLVHGEVADAEVDIFDREAVFIDRVLEPLRRRLPSLRIVLEHITTSVAVDYVRSGGAGLGATVTPHHLFLNRNDVLAGGIRPHYYCLPVAKREEHRSALRAFATSGFERVFLGTDSAPHTDGAKLQACGCAGIYNAPNVLSCLAHVFEEEGRLDRLEAFTSLNGAGFYGLPLAEETMTLTKRDEPVAYPLSIEVGSERVTVFDPGVDLFWGVDEAGV